METPHLTVDGLITNDGFLHVDSRIDLPPGPVHVTIEKPEQPAGREDTWSVLQSIWAARKARGAVARTKEEIDTEINEMRDADEERMREIERLHEEARRQRAQRK